MYNVYIHPWTGHIPNKDIKIASFQFKTKDEAVEFITHYNSHYFTKIALLVEDNQLESA